MKKIIEKLEKSGINYELNNYGNGQYFNDGFSVPGIVVTVCNYGMEENAPEVVKSVLKAIGRSRSYIIADSGAYGIESYRIHLKADYDALQAHETAVKETSGRFWEIMRAHGKAAADAYYWDAVRRHNIKVKTA